MCVAWSRTFACYHTGNQTALFLRYASLKLLCSLERIFLGSSNSKSTVHRCSETCESALALRTKIIRYEHKPTTSNLLLCREKCEHIARFQKHHSTKRSRFFSFIKKGPLCMCCAVHAYICISLCDICICQVAHRVIGHSAQCTFA